MNNQMTTNNNTNNNIISNCFPVSYNNILTPKSYFNFSSDYQNPIKQNKQSNTNTTNNKGTSFINNSVVMPNPNNYSNIENISSMNNNNTSYIYSSSDGYWQRRENEEKSKLNHIKNEMLKKEQSEVRDRPLISKNSQRIANRIRNKTNEKIYDRLNSGVYEQKKTEEIQNIRRQNSFEYRPKINQQSKNIKRSVDDLYIWQTKVDRKKSENLALFNKMNRQETPQICEGSNEILRKKKQEYLSKRVEDRLLEQGEKSKIKIEEEKEHLIESASKGKQYVSKKTKDLYYCTGEEKTKPNPNPYGYVQSKLFDYEKVEKAEKAEKAKKAAKLNKKTKNNIPKGNNRSNSKSYKSRIVCSCDDNLNSCRNNHYNKDGLGIDNYIASKNVNNSVINTSNYISNYTVNTSSECRTPKAKKYITKNFNSNTVKAPNNEKNEEEKSKYNFTLDNFIKNKNILTTNQNIPSQQQSQPQFQPVTPEQNKLIDIRKHLNAYYDNKQNHNVPNTQVNKSFSYISDNKNKNSTGTGNEKDAYIKNIMGEESDRQGSLEVKNNFSLINEQLLLKEEHVNENIPQFEPLQKKYLLNNSPEIDKTENTQENITQNTQNNNTNNFTQQKPNSPSKYLYNKNIINRKDDDSPVNTNSNFCNTNNNNNNFICGSRPTPLNKFEIPKMENVPKYNFNKNMICEFTRPKYIPSQKEDENQNYAQEDNHNNYPPSSYIPNEMVNKSSSLNKYSYLLNQNNQDNQIKPTPYNFNNNQENTYNPNNNPIFQSNNVNNYQNYKNPNIQKDNNNIPSSNFQRDKMMMIDNNNNNNLRISDMFNNNIQPQRNENIGRIENVNNKFTYEQLNHNPNFDFLNKNNEGDVNKFKNDNLIQQNCGFNYDANFSDKFNFNRLEENPNTNQRNRRMEDLEQMLNFSSNLKPVRNQYSSNSNSYQPNNYIENNIENYQRRQQNDYINYQNQNPNNMNYNFNNNNNNCNRMISILTNNTNKQEDILNNDKGQKFNYYDYYSQKSNEKSNISNYYYYERGNESSNLSNNNPQSSNNLHSNNIPSQLILNTKEISNIPNVANMINNEKRNQIMSNDITDVNSKELEELNTRLKSNEKNKTAIFNNLKNYS